MHSFLVLTTCWKNHQQRQRTFAVNTFFKECHSHYTGISFQTVEWKEFWRSSFITDHLFEFTETHFLISKRSLRLQKEGNRKWVCSVWKELTCQKWIHWVEAQTFDVRWEIDMREHQLGKVLLWPSGSMFFCAYVCVCVCMRIHIFTRSHVSSVPLARQTIVVTSGGKDVSADRAACLKCDNAGHWSIVRVMATRSLSKTSWWTMANMMS